MKGAAPVNEANTSANTTHSLGGPNCHRNVLQMVSILKSLCTPLNTQWGKGMMPNLVYRTDAGNCVKKLTIVYRLYVNHGA